MRAVMVRDGGLVLGERAAPAGWPGGVTVAVRAFSLNPGDLAGALAGGDGDAPLGWDFAGVVTAAPAGGAVAVGDRVAGLTAAGAWAAQVVVAPIQLARLPDEVDFATGAALPVAGLSARLALDKRAPLDGLDVLVTGATGGVGAMAVQLAARAGARVVALTRDARHAPTLRALGGEPALGMADKAARGPFDLIVDSVGGSVLEAALGRMRSRAACVLVGDAEKGAIRFDPFAWRSGDGGDGGKTIHGFFLGEEVMRTGVTAPLGALLVEVAAGRLDAGVSVVRDWAAVGEVARDLIARRFTGKAVLTVG